MAAQVLTPWSLFPDTSRTGPRAQTETRMRTPSPQAAPGRKLPDCARALCGGRHGDACPWPGTRRLEPRARQQRVLCCAPAQVGSRGRMDGLGGAGASRYCEDDEDDEGLEGSTAGTKGSRLPPISSSASETTRRKGKKKKKRKKTEGSGKGDGKRNS